MKRKKKKLKDTDKDGVPDKYDCEPKNPKKHGALSAFVIGAGASFVGSRLSSRYAKAQRIKKLKEERLKKQNKYWK